MLLDAREFPHDTSLDADICIIGGGAAGITIALQFVNRPVDVVLLESGGLKPDPDTQALYSGENIGFSYCRPDESRTRFFGGSTNCWGGWCRPLDLIDFETRSWVPNSGWPISRTDLDPFYRRSHDLLQLGSYDYDPGRLCEELDALNSGLMPLDEENIRNVINRLSPPVRFGEAYRTDLARAGNVRIILNANVTDIGSNDSATITSIAAATLSGVRFKVRPKLVVLATGGIENARLLLASNKNQTCGLGNGHDQVGRYFMDHPTARINVVRLSAQSRHRPLYDNGLILARKKLRQANRGMAAHFAPVASEQQREGLTNSRTYIVPLYFGATSAAYRALQTIRLNLRRRSKFGTSSSRIALEVASQLRKVVPSLPKAMLSVLDNRLDPKFVRRDFYLETVIEQAPNPDSRILLSDKTDPLGVHRVRVDWRIGERDHFNFVRTQEIVVGALEKQGFMIRRRMVDDESWKSDVRGCWHHIGTTRMASDPRAGVVDTDCRVHGTQNLFIAGSSVFPTSGSDSPTMTLVALSLRLSGHLIDVLRLGALV